MPKTQQQRDWFSTKKNTFGNKQTLMLIENLMSFFFGKSCCGKVELNRKLLVNIAHHLLTLWWNFFFSMMLRYKDAYNYLKQHPETGLKMVGEMRELKHFKKFEAVARFTWRVSIFSFIAIVGAVVNYLATVGYWSFMTLLWFLLPLVVSIWG